METAELMKSNAQDYIHDLAYRVAEALKAGNLEDERDYNRILHITIRSYQEAGILTEEETTKPVCEAYREQFTEESKEKPASTSELMKSMRRTALGDVHGLYEEAAKANICEASPVESEYLAKAQFASNAYIKLGLMTDEDRRNQYVSAYTIDYGIKLK